MNAKVKMAVEKYIKKLPDDKRLKLSVQKRVNNICEDIVEVLCLEKIQVTKSGKTERMIVEDSYMSCEISIHEGSGMAAVTAKLSDKIDSSIVSQDSFTIDVVSGNNYDWSELDAWVTDIILTSMIFGKDYFKK